jgi:aspartokinase-like uncharacterized kinase
VTPLVLKIGGSLEKSRRLAGVLAIVGRARRWVVIVPGGGVFADAVRKACARHAVPDRVAHRQAILAMHQMAHLMIALEPRLVAAESIEGMAQAWEMGLTPVWLPLALCEGDTCIPEDWSITSDGLAARLAERLCGAPVALVKSCTVDPNARAEALAEEGIVDEAFATIVARAGLDWRIFGPGEEGALLGLIGGVEAHAVPARTV